MTKKKVTPTLVEEESPPVIPLTPNAEGPAIIIEPTPIYRYPTMEAAVIGTHSVGNKIVVIELVKISDDVVFAYLDNKTYIKARVNLVQYITFLQ
jgi:hypothetical protein